MRLVSPTVLRRRLEKKGPFSEIKMKAGLELTTKCNYNCVHCYHQKSQTPDITTQEWMGIIDLVSDAGCLFVYLTGGEPLLRYDFEDIYRYLKSKGLLITIFTNGSTIKKKHIELFKELPPSSIDITLYSTSNSSHREITRQNEGAEKIFRNIKLLHEHGITFLIKTVLLKENREEVSGIAKLAHQYDMSFRLDAGIHAARDGDVTPLRHRASPQEAATLERMANQNEAFCDKRFGGIEPGNSKAQGRYFNCCVERGNGIFIFANGSLAPCNNMFKWAQKVNKNSLSSQLTNFWASFYVNNPIDSTRYDKCVDCEYRSVCPACTVALLHEEPLPEKPAPFYCDLCKERYKLYKKNKKTKEIAWR